MSTTKQNIKDSYPLPVYNFKVTLFDSGLLGIPGVDTSGGDPITLGFSEVNGLTMEKEHVVYKHGFSFLSGFDVIPAQPKTVTVTLKRGILKGGSDLADWYKDKAGLLGLIFGNIKKDIKIDLCDETGTAVVSWKLRASVPIKLDAGSFTASSNEVAIETLEVIGASLSVEYL